MNSKLIMAGAGLFGFGAVVSWALTADHYERRMTERSGVLEHMLRRQIDEANALRAEKMLREKTPWPAVDTDLVEELDNAAAVTTRQITPEEEAEDSRISDEIFSTDDSDSVEFIAPIEEEPTEETVEETRTQLRRLIDQYTSDPEAIEQFEHSARREAPGAREVQPFVISRELYAHDPDGEGDEYDKVTLTYYPKTRVLLDEDQELLKVEDYVGWRALSQFGGESGDTDVVFVRNRRLDTDYEVVREDNEDPPLHIQYGMGRDEFAANKAAGVIKFRDEDSD